MQDAVRWIPIYTTQRTLAAFLGYPYLFNTRGEWIGVVAADGKVYDITGAYVGYLDPDPTFPRVLRKRDTVPEPPPIIPPPPPTFVPRPDWTVPLPPPPPGLPPGVIDVLATQPERLSPHPQERQP